MNKMVEFSFQATGDIQDYIADPELILKKFPNTINIKRVDDGQQYQITRQPLNINNVINIPNVSVTKVTVGEDFVKWEDVLNKKLPSNVVSVGSVEAIDEDTIEVTGKIFIYDEKMNSLMWTAIQNFVTMMKTQTINQFKANIENPAFANAINDQILG